MSGFLIGAALLFLLTLAFLLPPLLRSGQSLLQTAGQGDTNLDVLREQLRELDADLARGLISPEAYRSARADLEQRVVEEARPRQTQPGIDRGKHWAASAIGLSMPVAAMVMYLMLGSPAALDSTNAGNGTAHEPDAQQVEDMVAALARRLQEQPDNVEGWYMLARSYSALERYREASDAYAHLATLLPKDADLMADYADTLAMAMGRSLQGEPEALIERALAIDPDNIKALALAGTAAFERHDYAQAVERWQRILRIAPADSGIARSTIGSIAEARSRLGQESDVTSQTPQPSPSPDKPEAGAERIKGVLELDPALRDRVAQTDTVFVYARPAEGSRMPLAVLRKTAKDLPLEFVLDDSMSMLPDRKLSDFSLVVIEARISKTGSAVPAPDDLTVRSEALRPGAAPLRLRIAAP